MRRIRAEKLLHQLDEMPAGEEAFDRWIRAGAHLEFVAQNVSFGA